MRRSSVPGSPLDPSEIAPREVFEQRRALIRAAAAGTFGVALAPLFTRSAFAETASPNSGSVRLPAKINPQFVVMENPTSYKDITTYNNYYEFGTDKADPGK